MSAYVVTDFDFQVKDWGSGQPEDLGSLEVESFSPNLFADHSKPFYEQLARRLEELQVQHFLSITSVLVVKKIALIPNCPYSKIQLQSECSDCFPIALS